MHEKSECIRSGRSKVSEKREAQKGDVTENGNVLTLGDVRVDRETGIVTRADTTKRLTCKELQLLEALIRYEGRIVTREELYTEVWGSDYLGNTRTVDVHVKQLRRKLGRDDMILTAYKKGYYFGYGGKAAE